MWVKGYLEDTRRGKENPEPEYALLTGNAC